MKAIVIPADGSPAKLVDDTIDLKYMQGVVGGLIECVAIYEILTDAGRKHVEADLFVNEEGKLIGLPTNPRATDLAALTIGGWVHDVIKGDVIVTGQPDNEGRNTDVPQSVINIVRNWGWL